MEPRQRRDECHGHRLLVAASWSPPATLVAPAMWNLIGAAQLADVPPGLNLAHQHLRHGLGVTVIHLLIMPPVRPGPGQGRSCWTITGGQRREALIRLVRCARMEP